MESVGKELASCCELSVDKGECPLPLGSETNLKKVVKIGKLTKLKVCWKNYHSKRSFCEMKISLRENLTSSKYVTSYTLYSFIGLNVSSSKHVTFSNQVLWQFAKTSPLRISHVHWDCSAHCCISFFHEHKKLCFTSYLLKDLAIFGSIMNGFLSL